MSYDRAPGQMRELALAAATLLGWVILLALVALAFVVIPS